MSGDGDSRPSLRHDGGVVPVARQAPFLRLALLAGAAVLVALVLAGAARALLAREGARLLQRDYVPAVNSLLLSGRDEAALRQMRIAVRIDPKDRTVRQSVLPNMAGLAARLRDRQAEIEALAALVNAHPGDAELHVRLASALLRTREIPLKELRLAAIHAETAERLAPSDARAVALESLVARSLGQVAQADALLARSRSLDPSLVLPPAPRVTDLPRATEPAP